MFNSSSIMQAQSLFTHNLISDIESSSNAAGVGASVPGDVGAMAQVYQPVLGELVFGKFIKDEDANGGVVDEDDSPLLLDDSTPCTATSSLESAVDEFFFKSENPTPMFEFEDPTPSGQWTSLFDDNITITQKDVQMATDLGVEIDENVDKNHEERQKSQESLVIPKSSFLPTPVIEEDKLFKSPSTTQSSSIGTNGGVKSNKISKKIDHLGVVSYNRKNRSVPLSPVIAESDDPTATKRARNTEAARRSRARKLMRMTQLEDKVEELLTKNSQLEEEIKRLTSLLNR
ncbi:hypothetical protein HG535_0F02770 [Zygotorulaspora mrakii]|uniref:BZIP domain-containing protein n=1 Tax=Zygotorulaspora mrakii TaxID=42260 RepID=A0A7H9B627_ZYGMR|nr:uncharacterized protein HG535_0F02770 [Zygotorulaspora mrakii]QLG73766.1 hypothetical protein HG535_0F02770 [Zygotorulaspora mrakii]